MLFAKRDEILYMFALVPPEEVAVAIHEQRIIFAKKYGLKDALKPPVHITVCAPFKVNSIIAEAFERQMQSIQLWASDQTPFEIFLDGFGFFPNPKRPVLIINIAQNIHLQNMQQSFASYLKRMKFNKCRSRLNHHFTIGYSDIPPEVMPAIKDEYAMRSFKASFKCDQIQLWRHDRVNWRVAADYKFS